MRCKSDAFVRFVSAAATVGLAFATNECQRQQLEAREAAFRPTHVFSPFKFTPCPRCPVENIYDPHQPVTSISTNTQVNPPVTIHAVAPFYDSVFKPIKTVTFSEYDSSGRLIKPPYVRTISHQVSMETKTIRGKPYVVYRTTRVPRPTVVTLNVGEGRYQTRTITRAPTNIVYPFTTRNARYRTVRKTQTKTLGNQKPTPPPSRGNSVSNGGNKVNTGKGGKNSVNNGAEGNSVNVGSPGKGWQSKFYIYVRSPEPSLNGLTVSRTSDGRIIAGSVGTGKEFYINKQKQLADQDGDIVFFDDPATIAVKVLDNLFQLKIASVPDRDSTISSAIEMAGDVMSFKDEDGAARQFYACPEDPSNTEFTHLIKVAMKGSKMKGCTQIKLSQDVSFTGL